jgi:hypothetical protein
MAEILMICHQEIIERDVSKVLCYYESLAAKLAGCGNRVSLLNVRPLKPYYDSSFVREAGPVLEDIRRIKPELIIAFNNQITEEIIRATDCKVALFDADSTELFAAKDLIRKYHDRYYMVTSYAGWESGYQALGFKSDRVCSIHPATAVRRESLPKTNAVSFIGTNFSIPEYISLEGPNLKIKNFIAENRDVSLYQALRKTWSGESDWQAAMDEFCPGADFSAEELYCLFDERRYILRSVLDLGLSLYGSRWPEADHQIHAAYIPEAKFSLKHNQDLYNSSVINISISHPQTKGYAFPWRVYDIMASDGLLVGSYSSLLRDLTRGQVDPPMFRSPYEARELCQKYLREDSLRRELIEACNLFIDRHGRWEDNFRVLEELTGLKLLGLDRNEGGVRLITPPLADDGPGSAAGRGVRKSIRWRALRHTLIAFICHLPGIYALVPGKWKKKFYQRLTRNLNRELFE